MRCKPFAMLLNNRTTLCQSAKVEANLREKEMVAYRQGLAEGRDVSTTAMCLFMYAATVGRMCYTYSKAEFLLGCSLCSAAVHVPITVVAVQRHSKDSVIRKTRISACMS